MGSGEKGVKINPGVEGNAVNYSQKKERNVEKMNIEWK